ncbi:unnamed protein product [Caenorhabditis sp. 36 PRJEB53466]|nr:unnamed protein product [Caenorhabditis sp. 36 PRJEB53466]
MSLHCATLIEVPLDIFGAFIIIFRTPNTMKSVKWPMLNLHFWSSLYDISISLLTTPYMVFPALAGVPNGVLKWMGVGTAFQAHSAASLLALVATATLTVFENRFHILTAGKTVWSRHRIAVFSVAYPFMATFLLPFTLNTPDQKTALEITFRVSQQLPSIL